MSGHAGEIYALRFSAQDQGRREAAWRVLCEDFFARYVPADGTVIDVGAGDGLFLRHIRAGRRIAVDESRRVRALAAEGIEVRRRRRSPSRRASRAWRISSSSRTCWSTFRARPRWSTRCASATARSARAAA